MPRHPTDRVGLVWRPLRRNDLDDLSRLLTAIEHLDDPSERHSLADLTESFDETEPADAEAALQALLGCDGGGTVIAYAWNHPISGDVSPRRLYLAGGVHPGWRHRRIGAALLDWQFEQGRAWYRAGWRSGFGPLQLIAYVNDKLTHQRRLYEGAGMEAVRWYADMTLVFDDGPPPEVAAPPGVRLVVFGSTHSEGVRLAHNEAFADLWGSQPVDRVSWDQQLARSSCRLQWSWVALDERTLDVVGYAVNSAHEQDWVARGLSEGWTDRIGVRPGWRGRGIARALLTASMRSFAEAGLAAAGLGVDSDNPSGAFRLYERLGYEATDTVVMYARTEDPPVPG